MPKPTISPRELIVDAHNRDNGEPAGMRVLRSVITPLCQRNGRGFPLLSNDTPTTSPLSLIPRPPLATSPGSVPRSRIPVALVHRKASTPLNGVPWSVRDEPPTT